MSAPQPVPAVVCDACGQPWNRHLKMAALRTPRIYDEDENEIERPDEPVSLVDCLKLTMEQNRGPAGFIGMSGPQGPQGPQGVQGPVVHGPPFGGSSS